MAAPSDVLAASAEWHIAGATSIATRAEPMRAVYAMAGIHCQCVCVLPDGDICVTDWVANAVRRFTPDGTEWRDATITGVSSPAGVCLTLAGHLAVVCRGDETCVRVYTTHGEFVSVFGEHGCGAGQLHVPVGIALDLDGHLVVCDAGNNRLQVFTPTGVFLRTLGDPEPGYADAAEKQRAGWLARDGHFSSPYGVAVHPRTGHYYVADTCNHRIQVVSREGAFIRKWGTLRCPEGICVDADGTVFCAAWSEHRVQVFTSDGVSLGEIGCPGKQRLGHFWGPLGVAVDAAGRVYVADAVNSRVQVFE